MGGLDERFEYSIERFECSSPSTGGLSTDSCGFAVFPTTERCPRPRELGEARCPARRRIVAKRGEAAAEAAAIEKAKADFERAAAAAAEEEGAEAEAAAGAALYGLGLHVQWLGSDEAGWTAYTHDPAGYGVELHWFAAPDGFRPSGVVHPNCFSPFAANGTCSGAFRVVD